MRRTKDARPRHKRRVLILYAALGIISHTGSSCSSPSKHAPEPELTPEELAIHKELKQFEFKGKPIHPACVCELVGDLAHPAATTAAVDLEGCTRTNRYPAPFVGRDGIVRYDESKPADGFFQYRRIGTTPAGIHVLHTALNSGGNGMFTDLVMILIERDRTLEGGKLQSRVLMKRVGHFILGDRDDGEIRLVGNRLIIGASRYRSNEIVLDLP